VAIGDSIADERLVIGSADRHREAVEVLFRASPDEESERQNSIRLSAGWSGEGGAEGDQRLSIEGWGEESWSSIATFKADGKFGIGIAEPEHTLDVAGDASIHGDITFGSGSTRHELSSEDGRFVITNSDGTMFAISESHGTAIGLGTDTPSAQIHAVGPSAFVGTGTVRSAGSRVYG